MAKVILLFASMSGNTEMMADAVSEGIQEVGATVDSIDIMFGYEAEKLKEYDGIIFGAYTWGDGELPDDFLDLYEDLDTIELSGMKAAVFGSCDSSYEKYGAAVDILVKKLSDRGAELFTEGLKIELTPDEAEEEVCRTFGRDFIAFL
ncbi:flavodoxin [Fictibacillus nanhaiensis]|uniref:flavodoxin n=1 Tax=Fictibacillus nanhaiensis TaxID=742169 RepID=UPI002E1AE874|nr:flavodoxin [Fictibacillus nanhaiensis]